MPKVENVSEEYTLPEGALCFGPNGWVPLLEQIVIETAIPTLSEVLGLIWQEHQGILGVGELVFAQVGDTDGRPKGYLIFQPEEDDAPSPD